MTDLNTRAQTPMTRGDFEEFLRDLVESLAADPTSWPNDSLSSFLDGMCGWVSDLDGYFTSRREPIPSEPSWQLFAQAMLAARVYE